MSSKDNGDETIPRYEFRTFGRDLAIVADRIRRRDHYTTVRNSSETYLVAERGTIA